VDIARLWEDHHGPLYRYLVRLTGDADLADDVVQDTFAKLVAKPPRDENPRAWLYTVATNAVRAWSNRSSRRRRILDGAPLRVLADAPPDPAANAEAADRTARVRAALATLSERERTILLMREEGFAHREIADAVGTTTGSIGTMVARALDRLARHLPLDAEEF
jgi:RNA polymerase sigma factor (sigma-70 family)